MRSKSCTYKHTALTEGDRPYSFDVAFERFKDALGLVSNP